MSTTVTAMTRQEAKAQLVQQAIAEANGLPTTGYICKECGGPSPVGVGYASMAPEQTDVDACPCGYSVKPTVDTPATEAERIGNKFPARSRRGLVVGYYAHDGNKTLAGPFPTAAEAEPFVKWHTDRVKLGPVFTSTGTVVIAQAAA